MGDVEKVNLKACPFCGNDAQVVLDKISHKDMEAHIECMGCCIEVRYSDCIRSAIDIWNKRNYRVDGK